MVAQLTTPYRGFRFRVEISGIQVASFSEATVPEASIETVDYREGTDPVYKRALSGLSTYGRMTLKKGLTDSMDLYDWYQAAAEKGSGAAGARRNISLVLADTDGSDKVRWNIINAWPTKYDSTGLNAASTEVMIETFEIALDYMTRVK